MNRPPHHHGLTTDELLAADVLGIDDLDDAGPVKSSDIRAGLNSHDPRSDHLSNLQDDLASYTAENISSAPLEDLPELLHEIANKRICAEESWHAAFQNYLQVLSQQTIYFHEEDRLQITAASAKARMTTAVQDASWMSLTLRTLKESYLAAEKHVDYELRVRLAEY